MVWTGAKQELFVFLENSNSKYNQTIQSYLKNIPFGQSLRIKTICSSLTEHKRHCNTETKIHRKRIQREHLKRSNRSRRQ